MKKILFLQKYAHIFFLCLSGGLLYGCSLPESVATEDTSSISDMASLNSASQNVLSGSNDQDYVSSVLNTADTPVSATSDSPDYDTLTFDDSVSASQDFNASGYTDFNTSASNGFQDFDLGTSGESCSNTLNPDTSGSIGSNTLGSDPSGNSDSATFSSDNPDGSGSDTLVSDNSGSNHATISANSSSQQTVSSDPHWRSVCLTLVDSLQNSDGAACILDPTAPGGHRCGYDYILFYLDDDAVPELYCISVADTTDTYLYTLTGDTPVLLAEGSACDSLCASYDCTFITSGVSTASPVILYQGNADGLWEYLQ